MITLGNGSAQVVVDETLGARIASLVVGGRERLVPQSVGAEAMAWGLYPMVPWAGRVRRGRFTFAGRVYDLPISLPPHAIHGTVLAAPWTVDSVSASVVALTCPLGPDWPWPGHVSHVVSLERSGVRCRLEVVATGDAFPAQVGWHPWFSDGGHPPALTFGAQGMYERDDDGIPDGSIVAPGSHPWDDCFVGVTESPRLRYGDGLELTVSSDCDHWVVYEPEHAVCVEPQSGPPDGFTVAPHVVEPGRPLSRTMTIDWP